MQRINMTVAELALVALTRGLAGVGIGLLVSEHLYRSQRRAAGWGLLALGALSTIPLGLRILPRAIGKNAGDE